MNYALKNMSIVFVNIGSNLGNRRLNLSRAIRAIGEEFGEYEISHVVESEPWGFDSTHSFLNVCVMFRSDLAPLDILHRLRAIEHGISPASHRNPDGTYADRIIDIDIVAMDVIREGKPELLVMDTPELTLPHPRLKERDFFLRPLLELAPAMIERL